MLKIAIDSTVILEAIKIVSTLAPPMTGNVIMDAVGGKLVIISIGEANRCQLSLPCELSGDGTFAIPVATLGATVKGRATLKMLYENDVLNIVSGTYKTTLATVDVIKEPQTPVDGLEGIVVTAEQASWLSEALRDTYIKPDVMLNQTLNHVAVKLDADGAFVCCYDGERLAYSVNGDITGNLDVTLPHNTLSAVLSTFGVSGFKLAMQGGVMYVWNKVGVATLSLIAPKFTVPTEALMAKIEDSRQKPVAKWRIDIEEANIFLMNAKAITSNGTKSTLSVRVEPKTAHLKVATSSGSTQVSFPARANAEAEFLIDYEYFGEFVGKSLPEMFIHPTYISGHDETFGMIVSLNQG